MPVDPWNTDRPPFTPAAVFLLANRDSTGLRESVKANESRSIHFLCIFKLSLSIHSLRNSRQIFRKNSVTKEILARSSRGSNRDETLPGRSCLEEGGSRVRIGKRGENASTRLRRFVRSPTSEVLFSGYRRPAAVLIAS